MGEEMVKYDKEIERQIIKLFEKNILVTTDVLKENIKMTPAVIIEKLMDEGTIARFIDPIHHNRRYLYYLCTRKKEAEEELKHRKTEALYMKHKQLQKKIKNIERARSHHVELVSKYDKELKELREKLRFLSVLISPE